MSIVGLGLLACGLVGTAQAALIDRGSGMIYDSDQDITWLQEANYARTSGHDADGRMNWGDAMAWADGLNYGGYDNWRLPTIAQPDSSCSSQYNHGSGLPVQGYGRTGQSPSSFLLTEKCTNRGFISGRTGISEVPVKLENVIE